MSPRDAVIMSFIYNLNKNERAAIASGVLPIEDRRALPLALGLAIPFLVMRHAVGRKAAADVISQNPPRSLGRPETTHLPSRHRPA